MGTATLEPLMPDRLFVIQGVVGGRASVRGWGSSSSDDGSFDIAHLQHLDVAEPPFDSSDLASFCWLDRLGLTETARHVDTDHNVLACRVVEPHEVTERSCRCTRRG